MGQLLARLRGGPSYNVNLLEATANEEDPQEMELYQSTAELIASCQAGLKAIQGYQGIGDLLRQAMSAPKDEAIQTKAYKALLPNVDIIKSFFDLSVQLGDGLVRVVTFLAGRDPLAHQAIFKHLADLLDFVLAFDTEKMMKPALQNDFAFYRRNFGKISQLPEVKVQEAEANYISMFIAQNVPMMIACEKSIKAMGEDSSSGEPVRRVLALLANVTCCMANLALGEDTLRYSLRVMTAAMVLYDRITTEGVFVKGSDVSTRKCLRTIHANAVGTTTSALAQQLSSCLKYSTVHFKDPTTPSFVQAALGD